MWPLGQISCVECGCEGAFLNSFLLGLCNMHAQKESTTEKGKCSLVAHNYV